MDRAHVETERSFTNICKCFGSQSGSSFLLEWLGKAGLGKPAAKVDSLLLKIIRREI